MQLPLLWPQIDCNPLVSSLTSGKSPWNKGAKLSLMFKTDHVLLGYELAIDYYHTHVTEKENQSGPIIKRIKPYFIFY